MFFFQGIVLLLCVCVGVFYKQIKRISGPLVSSNRHHLIEYRKTNAKLSIAWIQQVSMADVSGVVYIWKASRAPTIKIFYVFWLNNDSCLRPSKTSHLHKELIVEVDSIYSWLIYRYLDVFYEKKMCQLSIKSYSFLVKKKM